MSEKNPEANGANHWSENGNEKQTEEISFLLLNITYSIKTLLFIKSLKSFFNIKQVKSSVRIPNSLSFQQVEGAFLKGSSSFCQHLNLNYRGHREINSMSLTAFTIPKPCSIIFTAR